MSKSFTTENYEWSLKGLESCLKDNRLKSKIIAKNDKAAIVHVISYHDSQILGALTDWCISQHKCSWEQYVEKKNNFQVFVYDFSRKPSDELSITGSTWEFNKEGYCHLMCCFTRPNNPIGKVTKYESDAIGLYYTVLKPTFNDEFSIGELIEEVNKNPTYSIDLTIKKHVVTEENYSPTVYDAWEYFWSKMDEVF